MADICITVPKTIKWEDYKKELEKVKDGTSEMNFKLPTLPKNVSVGNKCYVCHDGFIRGWMKISFIGKRNGFDCTTTGQKWDDGIYVSRTGEFHYLENPIPMKGFHGYRLINEKKEIKNNMKTIKISESKLRKMITEAVTRNLFGGPIGESDDFRGCKSIKIRWQGEWSDPELLYNGYVANYYEIEDYFYNIAKEEGIDADNDEEFNRFIQSREEDVCEMIMNVGEKEYNPFEN